MRHNVVVAAVVAAVVGAAGCGGSSSGLTSRELVTRADALCTQYQQRANAAMSTLVRQATRDANRQAHQRRYATQIASIQSALGRQEYAALGALNAPSALKADFTRFVTIRRQSVALIPSIEDRLSGRNPNKPQTDRIGHEAAALAHKIGFKVCL